MWKRKELKNRAKQVVRKNYWTAIVVCFLIALLTGEFGTSILGIWQSNDSMDPNYILHNENIIMNEPVNGQILDIEGKKIELTDAQLKIFKMIEANLNSATKSQKYIFKIWDAVKSFNINKIIQGTEISIAAAISLIFTIIIAEPLVVSGRRYFLKARQDSKTKIGEMLETFKRGNWFNVVSTMFLKNLYNILWYLTIIGGIIKTYEYRMIPYILAENPKIKRKEAFKLSKEMMKGNKWKTFILDASFWLWNLASIFTFGLLNIFFVNPYKVATTTELYMVLRKKAITEKYEYYEELNDKKLK